MSVIQSFFDKILAVVNLPANKQVIFILLTVAVVFSFITYGTYKKNAKEYNTMKNQIIALEVKIEAKDKYIDSLYYIIYNKDLIRLQNELQRSDSLLKASNKIKVSINPIIKKLNKKINKINESNK